MPEVTTTTQDEVLDRVVARLIDRIGGRLNPANCYQTVEPYPDHPDLAHVLFCQVSPGPGEFDQGALAGGGANTPFELAQTWVTVYNRVRLDPTNRAESILKEAARGLLILKRQVLEALTGHHLTNANGVPILINYMVPRQATQPALNPEDKVAYVSIAFQTDFEWNLT